MSSPDTAGAPTVAPALALGVLLLAAGAVAWPAVLGRFVSLDWHVGDVRPAAYSVSAILLGAGVVAIVLQGRLARRWARSFPTPRSLALAVLTAALSTVLVVGATEVALRLLGLPFRSSWTPSENALARFDPELGWAYVPNRSHLEPFGRLRRPVPIYFDAFGARAGRPDTIRDPAAPTVLVVGGSFAFGHGLPYEETLAGFLEEATRLQVVNLGVQGYGTDQALILLKRILPEFRVVVVVYVFIDDHVARNANHDRRLIYPDARFLGTKPRFHLDRHGELRLRDQPQRYEDRTGSRLWDWAQLAWTRNGPVPDVDLTRALVLEMQRYVESQGAAFVVVHWRQDIEFPEGSGHRSGGGGGTILDGMNLRTIDAGSQAPAGWDEWSIPGDPHPDARAHDRVARLVIAELERLGIVH